MADRIADELLRFTATSSFRPHDDEVRAIAAELLAARAEVERLRACVALLERVRNEAEWVRKAYELDDNDDQGATDLCAALDAAKDWHIRYGKLLEKHKETP